MCREHHFRFCWEPGDTKPSFTDSYGRNIPVHVEHSVPYIGHRGAKACFSGKHVGETRDIGVGAPAFMGKKAGTCETAGSAGRRNQDVGSANEGSRTAGSASGSLCQVGDRDREVQIAGSACGKTRVQTGARSRQWLQKVFGNLGGLISIKT